MAHFAELDENNIVQRVLVVDNEVITKDGKEDEELGVKFLKGLFGESTIWKQTSYNGTFRKNFAGKTMKYDEQRDAFIPLNGLFPSWVFNEDNCRYEPPIHYPDNNLDKRYFWDEDSEGWKVIDE